MINGQKYRKSNNLFDYMAYFGSTFISYNEFFNYAELQLQPNTTYTLSTSYREYTVSSTTRVTAFIVATSSGTPTTANGGISNVSPITITTESDGVLKLYKRISGSTADMTPTEEQFEGGDWIMLNTGSTALPYEPYGNIWTDVPIPTRKYVNGSWIDISPKQYVNGEWI